MKIQHFTQPNTAMKACFAALLLSGASQQSFAAEYNEIKRLGGQSSAICRPAINSAAELQSFALNQSQDVQDILASAGWEGDNAAFFSAIEEGRFEEKSYPTGTKFEWMGLRKGGKPVAAPKQMWAGKQSFDGYELNIVSDCQQHTIVIPKACCNVALIASTPVSADVAAPVISSSSDGDMVTINIDSNGANTITELVRPDGSTEVLDTTGGSWSGQLPAGDYQVTSKTVSDCGESDAALYALPVGVPVAMLAPAAGGLFFAPFIGRQIRAVDPLIVGGQVGYLHPLSTNVDFLVQGGVSYNTKHEETSLFVDLGLERRFGSNGGFFGGGVGLWDFNTDDLLINGESGQYTREDTTYFIHGGANTGWSYHNTPIKWFVEARVFDDFTDDISNHNLVRVGLRYMK